MAMQHETPQLTSRIGSFGSSIIKAVDPSLWRGRIASYGFQSGVAALTITLLAVLVPLLLLWAVKRYRKMQDEKRKPFRFTDLPQELRDMIYENLVEDPIYPPPPPCHHLRSSFDWMIPSRRSSTSTPSSQPHKSNWIFLANKQVYKEYMDLLCKRSTFHLTVSPLNYQPSSPPTPVSSPLPPDNRIWKLAPSTLQHFKTCSLKLITTSAMLGVTDPRNMTSADWTLARQIREELKGMASATTLTLDAKAIGDPLWNPLWIWFHASQSFKTMGTALSDTDPRGPKLTKITFSLDTWSPGENHLERDAAAEGRWTWYCVKGHSVGVDLGPEITVREFCGKLYQECGDCRMDGGREGEGEGD